jgi:hypothetical protein
VVVSVFEEDTWRQSCDLRDVCFAFRWLDGKVEEIFCKRMVR